MTRFDLLVSGGIVIDPVQGIHGRRDVGIRDGRTVVEPPINADMPNVMSKFLHLGMPLVDVIRASTIRPAQTIGWDDRIGSLEVGRTADVAVLALEEGELTLSDSSKKPETATRRLVARHTIYGGRLLERGAA